MTTKAERNKEIAQLYLSGMTNQAVGKRFGISRERVRQIVERDVPAEKRFKHRRHICNRCGGVPVTKFACGFDKQDLCQPCYDVLMLTIPTWSTHYDKCIECGTTDNEHQGFGRCTNCYRRKRYDDRPEVRLKHIKKCADYFNNVIRANPARH